MTACPTLETERLTLRPLEESDLDAYTEMLMEPEVRRSLRLPRTYSRSDAWRGMAQWRGQWELRGSGQWAVTERSSGNFVGRAGLHCPELPDWPGMEVGWTLHPDLLGKGVCHRGGGPIDRLRLRGHRGGRGVQRHPPRERALTGRGPPCRAHLPRRAGAVELSGDGARYLEAEPGGSGSRWGAAAPGSDLSADGDRRRPAPPRR